MDQVTRLYTPARYIEKLAVYQGPDLVFSMAAGISISEVPNFRFTFTPNGAKMFRVEAEDTAAKNSPAHGLRRATARRPGLGAFARKRKERE